MGNSSSTQKLDSIEEEISRLEREIRWYADDVSQRIEYESQKRELERKAERCRNDIDSMAAYRESLDQEEAKRRKWEEEQCRAEREAEERAKREVEERAKREVEERAKREAEIRAKREAEERAKREAEIRAEREAEERAKREARDQKRNNIFRAVQDGNLDQLKISLREASLAIPYITEDSFLSSSYSYHMETPFHQAVSTGNMGICEYIVKKGVNVNTTVDERDNTPLHYASYYGKANICEFLIQNGARVDSSNSCYDDGYYSCMFGLSSTPLHLAVTRGYSDVCQVLINNGANLFKQDYDDRTPVDYALLSPYENEAANLVIKAAEKMNAGYMIKSAYYAARNGNLNLLKKYSERYLVVRDSIFKNSDQEDNKTLLDSIYRSNINICKFLIQNGVSVNSNINGLHGNYLFWAAGNSTRDVCELLIQNGAIVNKKQIRGETPLFAALENNKADICRLLVSKGADLLIKTNSGETVYDFAILNPKSEAAKFIIEVYQAGERSRREVEERAKREAEVEAKKRIMREEGERRRLEEAAHRYVTMCNMDHNLTPLHHAAADGNKEMCQFFIERKNLINSKETKYGGTPLHWAANNDKESVCEFLIQKGANIEAGDNNGSTPLHWASYSGKKSTCKLLIENGALVNERNKDGHTSLHMALNQGYGDICRLLVSKGADLLIKTNSGETVYDFAILNPKSEAAKFIIEVYQAEERSRGEVEERARREPSRSSIGADRRVNNFHRGAYDDSIDFSEQVVLKDTQFREVQDDTKKQETEKENQMDALQTQEKVIIARPRNINLDSYGPANSAYSEIGSEKMFKGTDSLEKQSINNIRVTHIGKPYSPSNNNKKKESIREATWESALGNIASLTMYPKIGAEERAKEKDLLEKQTINNIRVTHITDSYSKSNNNKQKKDPEREEKGEDILGSQNRNISESRSSIGVHRRVNNFHREPYYDSIDFSEQVALKDIQFREVQDDTKKQETVKENQIDAFQTQEKVIIARPRNINLDSYQRDLNYIGARERQNKREEMAITQKRENENYGKILNSLKECVEEIGITNEQAAKYILIAIKHNGISEIPFIDLEEELRGLEEDEYQFYKVAYFSSSFQKKMLENNIKITNQDAKRQVGLRLTYLELRHILAIATDGLEVGSNECKNMINKFTDLYYVYNSARKSKNTEIPGGSPAKPTTELKNNGVSNSLGVGFM